MFSAATFGSTVFLGICVDIVMVIVSSSNSSQMTQSGEENTTKGVGLQKGSKTCRTKNRS